jgi:hypothetical protein
MLLVYAPSLLKWPMLLLVLQTIIVTGDDMSPWDGVVRSNADWDCHTKEAFKVSSVPYFQR